METMRKDVERNKRQTLVKNSSLLGYSTNMLRYGDMFRYKETYTNGSFSYRNALCHGRIRPLNKINETDKIQWYILAQTVSENMQFTYERWVSPEKVVETVPKDKINQHIKDFFTEKEDIWSTK